MLLLPHSRTDRLYVSWKIFRVKGYVQDRTHSGQAGVPKRAHLEELQVSGEGQLQSSVPVADTNENTAPLCNYSLFANDYLHVFTPCGIIRLEMSTIRSKEMLDVHIKQFKLLSEETCKGRTPRKNVKPFYYRPEELLLATWNDDNEIELAYIKVDTE
uniref:CNH domain-containing protein n=1 Tax=Steinernema glaseri TaxID=37863 RepID=A0A1I8ARV7_9BILA